MGGVPPALALFEPRNAVDGVLGRISGEDGLKLGLCRSCTGWELVLYELRSVSPGSPR